MGTTADVQKTIQYEIVRQQFNGPVMRQAFQDIYNVIKPVHIRRWRNWFGQNQQTPTPIPFEFQPEVAGKYSLGHYAPDGAVGWQVKMIVHMTAYDDRYPEYDLISHIRACGLVFPGGTTEYYLSHNQFYDEGEFGSLKSFMMKKGSFLELITELNESRHERKWWKLRETQPEHGHLFAQWMYHGR